MFLRNRLFTTFSTGAICILASAAVALGSDADTKLGAAMTKDHITLAKAARTAADATRGHIISIEASWAGKSLEFTAKASARDKIVSVSVKGKTGKAGAVRDLSNKSSSSTDAKNIGKLMDKGNFDFAKAITTAEAHCKGQAISATSLAGAKSFELHVRCLVGGKTTTVRIDGKTGTVITEKATQTASAKKSHAAKTPKNTKKS